MNSYKYELTGAMLAIGVLVFVVVAAAYSVVVALASGLVSMALYLAGARLSVVCYTILSHWAHRGITTGQSTDRSMMAILWPLALPIAVVVYGALGIVNRVMPDVQS
jgi:hypothetical protein